MNLNLSEIKRRMGSYDKTKAERDAVYKIANRKLIDGLESEVTEAEYIELWYKHDHYYHYIDNINQYRPHAKVADQLTAIKQANPCYVTPAEYHRPSIDPMEGTGMSLAEASKIMRMNLDTNSQYALYRELLANYDILVDYHSTIGSGYSGTAPIASSNNNIDPTVLDISYLIVPTAVQEAVVKFAKIFTVMEATHRIELLDQHDLQRVRLSTHGKYPNTKLGVRTIQVNGVMIAKSNNYVLIP